MQKVHTIFIFVFFFLLLSSCKTTVENNQLPTDTSINNTNQPNQTWTPEALNNSSTPTINAQIATSKASNIATHTAAYATLQSRKVICNEGYDFYPLFPVDIVNQLDLFQTPTDKWTVLYCLPIKENTGAGYTQIINHDASIIWTISYENINPAPYHFLGASGIDKNKNVLYLAPALTNFSGVSKSYYFGRGTPIYQINLETGEIIAVLERTENSYFGSSFSGNFKYFAYSEDKEPVVIYIQDLLNKEVVKTIKIDEPYERVGGFVWSSDNKYFLFVAGQDGWEEGLAGVSLFRLNMKTLHLQVLLLNDKRNLVPWYNSDTFELWLDENTLNLISLKEQDSLTENWSINIETGQLLQISTPTP